MTITDSARDFLQGVMKEHDAQGLRLFFEGMG
jgi:hypothetical protein